MQLSGILTQMGVIAIVIIIGYFCKAKEAVHTQGTKDMSWLVINVCGPCQVLFSVLGAENLPDRSSVIHFFFVVLGIYAVLIAFGHLMGPLLRAPRSEWKFYNVMAVFGNTGFLGLPLCQAILGNDAMIYMVMFNLGYNVFFYTWALSLLQPEGVKYKINLRSFINPGAIASICAILLFFTGISLPAVFKEVTRYSGNAVTFMSVFIIGANLYDVSLKTILGNVRGYFFILIRGVAVPIIAVFIAKALGVNPLITGVLAIGLSVPVGNAPSMAAATNGCDLKTLTEVTVMSTALCVITMTVVLLVAM